MMTLMIVKLVLNQLFVCGKIQVARLTAMVFQVLFLEVMLIIDFAQ
jgi:hypothetical protein